MENEIRQADRVLVLTSVQRQTLIESGVDESKLLLIPLGIHTDAFHPVARDGHPPFRVLFAGRLSQGKGLSYALEGFRRADPRRRARSGRARRRVRPALAASAGGSPGGPRPL